MEKQSTAGQATDDIMVHAHCMLDTQGYTHTLSLSEYEILIAVALQQWLCERATMLRYTYSACLVSFTDREVG